jgi:hypothetical protein
MYNFRSDIGDIRVNLQTIPDTYIHIYIYVYIYIHIYICVYICIILG